MNDNIAYTTIINMKGDN